MKKQKHKKLVLDSKKIRNLTTPDLVSVAGAVPCGGCSAPSISCNRTV